LNCPICENENPDAAKFCGSCGGSLARTITCSGCEAENPRANRFCHECGGNLVDTSVRAAERDDPRDYTPQHLAEKILHSKSALEGERKQVTVLFADVTGSLEMAESVDPEEWHRILDRFFKILADGVHRFEGTVNQYTGDGVMALFGAPIAHEDHAQRSCYAALELRSGLQEYARDLKREFGLNFSVRMGINSGDVVVGKIGDNLRMDYTAQGATVGMAARMQELASPDTVYLTGQTANRVTGYFDLEDLGVFNVKGASEPVAVSQLQGVGSHLTRFDVSRARGLTRFVGRDSDMQTLESALERATEGNGQVVGVVADAGTGKSRLCFEFVERCRAQGMTVIEGHAVAHGKNIPYLPMLQAFRTYYGITDQDSDRIAREKIAGHLLLFDESFRDALPVLFDFFGVPDPKRPPPTMDPEARQRLLFSVLRRVVQRGENEGPTITLIEDLHWIDSASEALLEEWVDAVGGAQGLLLLNFRPEYHAAWMKKSYYHQLALAPLGSEAIRELVGDLLGDDSSLGSLVDVIHGRTVGNPFFTEEVVRGLIEAGNLEGNRGAYRLVTPIDRLGVPTTVQDVLAARIDRLAEREKQVLQPASVIGKEFTQPILEVVAELSRTELVSSLHALKGAEFIYEQALYPVAEFAFKHPLTQQVALESQLHDRRRRTHSAVANAIEAASPEKVDENAALIAHHWEEADEALLAARWHRRAAEWIDTSDFQAAQKHWNRVRTLAHEAGRERPLAEASELGSKACVELLNLGWRVGISEHQALVLFEEAQRFANSSDDQILLADALQGYGGCLFLLGNLEGSREPLDRALEISRNHGTSKRVAGALNSFIDLHVSRGQLTEALDVCDEILERLRDDFEYGNDDWGFSLHIWTLGRRGAWVLPFLGRLEEAKKDMQRAVALARQHDEQEVLGWTLGTWNFSAPWLDDPSALGMSQQAVEIAEKIGSPLSLAAAVSGLGAQLSRSGQTADGVEVLERGVRHSREKAVLVNFLPWFIALLAEGLTRAGQASRAVEVAAEAIESSLEIGTPIFEALAQLEFARALRATRGEAAAGEHAEALKRAEVLITQTGAVAIRALVHEARASFAALTGDAVVLERERFHAARELAEIGSNRDVRLD
jgi:class 3 adenylate cyclase/tetratricopeptide (TPR) repeat protein